MEEKREGPDPCPSKRRTRCSPLPAVTWGGLFKARMDEGLYLLYANDSYYAIHGYTRGQLEQEMHGRRWGWCTRRMWRGSASTCGGPWQKTRGPSPFEYRIVRRDGAVVWLHQRRAVPGGRGMVLSGMILDITARKAMEDRLRRSEERFQIAVRQAGDQRVGV